MIAARSDGAVGAGRGVGSPQYVGAPADDRVVGRYGAAVVASGDKGFVSAGMRVGLAKCVIDSLDVDLALTPAMEEAEFALAEFVPVVYREGSVAASGSRSGAPVAGKRFVEMVGYAPVAPQPQPTPAVQP